MLDIRKFNRGITLSGSQNEPNGHRNMKHTHERNLNVAGFILAIALIAGFFAWQADAEAHRTNTWKAKVAKVTQGVPQR